MKLIQVEERQLYKIARVQSNWHEMQEAARWCQQNSCGKQVGVSLFGFKTDSELTMFRLRWDNE